MLTMMLSMPDIRAEMMAKEATVMIIATVEPAKLKEKRITRPIRMADMTNMTVQAPMYFSVPILQSYR